MKLLSFDNFKKMQAIVEHEELLEGNLLERMDLWEAEQLLNEGFSSTILQQLIAGDTKQGRWGNKFQVDLYKKYKLAIGDIQDTDFTVLTDPSAFFKAPYKNNDNFIGFCVNDNPDVMQRVEKRTSGSPLLIAIAAGGRGLFYGFGKEPSSRQGGEDKYGALADKWGQSSYFGLKYSDIKPSNAKWIQEFTTKVYVINLEDLRAKYSVSDKQNQRATARKGAMALIDNKTIKAENTARYKKILSEKVGPADILAQFQRIFTSVSNGIASWASKIKLDDIEVVKQYGEFQLGGHWRNTPGYALEKIYSTFGSYMYDYVEFARYEARIERIAACIESGKTEDGAELTEELRQRYAAQVEYYQQDLKQRAVKFVDYKHQFDKYEKEVASGLTMLDGLLTPEGKSKLELR
jgi:hypothetical protein